MDVIGFDHLLVDYVENVSALPSNLKKGDKNEGNGNLEEIVNSLKFVKPSLGGSVGNIIRNLKKLECNVSIAGSCGNDFIGEFYMYNSNLAGVKNNIAVYPGYSGFARVLISPDDRTFQTYKNNSNKFSIDDFNRLLKHNSDFVESKLIILSGYIVEDKDTEFYNTICHMLNEVREYNKKIMLVLGGTKLCKDYSTDILGLIDKYSIDIVCANMDETCALTGLPESEAYKDLISRVSLMGVVTNGPKGLIIGNKNNIVKYPAIPTIPIVNHNGAGDAVATMVAYSVIHNYSRLDNIATLSNYAAKKVLQSKESQITDNAAKDILDLYKLAKSTSNPIFVIPKNIPNPYIDSVRSKTLKQLDFMTFSPGLIDNYHDFFEIYIKFCGLKDMISNKKSLNSNHENIVELFNNIYPQLNILSDKLLLHYKTNQVISNFEKEVTSKDKVEMMVRNLLNMFSSGSSILSNCEFTHIEYDMDKADEHDEFFIEIMNRFSAGTFSDNALEDLLVEGPLLSSLHYVLMEKKPLLCEDIKTDPYSSLAEGLDINSWITYPVLLENKKLIGYFHMTNIKGSEDEILSATKLLSDKLSFQLRNSQLYDNVVYLKQVIENNQVIDPLTKMFRYEVIKPILVSEIANYQRKGGDLSIAFLDLDYFRDVNNTYGHAVGDEVLAKFSELFLVNRLSDHNCRKGGEEFILFLPNTNIVQAKIALTRIKDIMNNVPFQTSAGDIKKTFSAGIVPVPYKNSYDIDYLVDKADNLLYCAKRAGRNRIFTVDDVEVKKE